MKRVAALLMSVWLGVQIGVGYVVAPILFANLEKMQAGQLAGELFDIVYYLGLFAWGWAFMAVGRTSAWEHGSANKHTRKWIGLLLVLILISEFLFAPTIAALKNNQTPFLVNWFGGTFQTWHGVSSITYLLETVLGLGILVKLLRLSD